MNILLDSKEFPYLVPTDVELVRVGNSETDGGYVIPKSIVDSVDGVLSLGIGNDWSFDQEFYSTRTDCTIHAYDDLDFDELNDQEINSYKSFFHGNKNVRHFSENIGRKGIRAEFTELDTAVDRLGKNNIFIKMDIEGGEYTLTETICNLRSKIAGMVIEYHGAAGSSKHCFLEELPELTKYYQVVHVHANNSGPVIDGFPDCLEISFLRKDLCLGNKTRSDVYIDHLDRPCTTFCDDYKIFFT
jgi:hypothetical protein